MFAMFHPQTTEIQPLKAERFSTKMLKPQKYDVIIYDVSADFGYLLAMKNSIIMSYSCAKFHHDMTINNRINCIFCFLFRLCFFWTTDRGLSELTSLTLCKSFVIFELCGFDGLSLCKISLPLQI